LSWHSPVDLFVSEILSRKPLDCPQSFLDT
jgi:hypothetical protein